MTNRQLKVQSLLLMILPICASGQVSADDPCPTAAFNDSSKLVDYRLKREELLGSSADFRKAELALSEARLALTKDVPQDLYIARFEAETAKIRALNSDAARYVLVQIGDACYERLTKYPEAEVAAVNALAKALQALIQSPEKLKQDTARLQRDFATTSSTVVALKLALAQVRTQLRSSRK